MTDIYTVCIIAEDNCVHFVKIIEVTKHGY